MKYYYGQYDISHRIYVFTFHSVFFFLLLVDGFDDTSTSSNHSRRYKISFTTTKQHQNRLNVINLKFLDLHVLYRSCVCYLQRGQTPSSASC